MSLSTNEVLEIRKSCGYNEIVPSKIESSLSELKHIFLDPMGLMLLSLGFIYLFIGQTTDAIVLFIAFIPVTIVDVALELRAKKALSALKSTLSPMAKIIRDQKIVDVAIREIVVGDTIIFEEGQSIPADGIILESDNLQISEAALTGESLPIEKNIGNYFFAGTTIHQGRGIGKIEKIGSQTKFGKIANLLLEAKDESSPLKKKVNNVVKKVVLLAFIIAIVLFTFSFIKEQNFAKSLIDALTFGLASIPEEFPLVFTLYLSMGAYRLSKHGVLIKSLPSVETLGSVDVICTDKTGTLTEGKFKLEHLENLDHKLSNDLIWKNALLACEEKPVDAMEIAIYEKAEPFVQNINEWKLKWDYIFETKGKHMSHVWLNSKTSEEIIAMKGSVEGVLEHCILSPAEKVHIEDRVAYWAGLGKRLLGLASKNGVFNGNRDHDETNLKFIGLMIFSDPIRSSVKDAIIKCQENNIEIKMITGDHPLTAHAVADEIGLTHSHDYLYTGDQLAKMTEDERTSAYQNGAIFSRVLPEQKFEMVKFLKESNKIVAMTGDGINDSPALKIADIGISMGNEATDVARSSAQMVLMKNDFSGIIEAVFEGRKIFSNLKRSFSYLVSFHIPIIFFAFLSPLMGFGVLLLPIHIVLLELVVHPVSAFSFENLPIDPSHTDKKMMTLGKFFESFLAGLILSLASLYLYLKNYPTLGVTVARSIAFSCIMFGNIFFVLIESWPIITKRFVLTAFLLFSFLILILNIPMLSTIFYLNPISMHTLIYAFFISISSCIPSLLVRVIKRKRLH